MFANHMGCTDNDGCLPAGVGERSPPGIGVHTPSFLRAQRTCWAMAWEVDELDAQMSVNYLQIYNLLLSIQNLLMKKAL